MAASDSEDAAIDGEYVQEIAYVVPDGDVETTCNICHAEFLDVEDLNVHVKQVHEGSTSCSKICQFCEATYTDLEDYSRHIRDDHLLELKCCRCCTKCFVDQRRAKKHERTHLSHKSSMYACSQCSGLFTTQKELELHEIINHDNKYDGEILRCMPHLSSLLKLKVSALLQTDEKVLICHSCNFTSLDLTAYLHHLKDDKCIIYVCDKCGDIFKSKKNLIKHFRRKNICLDRKEYANDLTTCPTCKNEVHGKQMHAHLKFCKVYHCNPCNIRFETIDQLSAHQSEAHPSEVDITKCKYCPKEYVGKHALEKHIKRTHQHTFILYKYACRSCGEIFKHPQKLFAHYFIKHKDLLPYTCRICDKKFKVRKRFTIHIKLEHKGAGVVEFDDQYHVFFAEKKSNSPFVPTCVIPELIPDEDLDNSQKASGKVDKTNKTGNQKLRLLSIDSDEEERRDAQPAKKKRRMKKDIVTLTSSDDEEVEPLLIIKKRAERKRFQKLITPGKKKMKENSLKQKQFTCKVCKKYCYTYQNYHNHIKTHSKNESIECIKCSRSFRTKKELTEHVSTDHATSKLIETLKTVLERKQVETQNVNPSDNRDMPVSERFSKTIKRVKFDKPSIQAKISPVPNDLSVKNFIENFVPDVSESTPKEPKPDPVVTIKRYASPFYRKHTITMTKFTPEAPIQEIKLKMPEKFKEQDEEKIKLTVKLVQQPVKQSMFESYEKVPSYENTDNSQDYDDYEDYKNDVIPDVAQEVMLEETEEPPKLTIREPHKIVFPKLPQGYPNIHIATLQPQAPFFKIIKLKSTEDETIIIDPRVNKEPAKLLPQPVTGRNEVIRLPDGSKFVTANPLAHLLGDTPVEKVLEPTKNKHYKPAITNFKGLLVDALQNLDKPVQRRNPIKKTEI